MPVQTYRNFLRYLLWADAISCLACGFLQVALPGFLSLHFGLSQALLTGTGVFLLLYGVAVALLAMRKHVPNAIVALLVAGNIGWGILAVGLLLEGDHRITLLGKSYVVAQAFTVLILAQLQYFCLRNSRATQSAP